MALTGRRGLTQQDILLFFSADAAVQDAEYSTVPPVSQPQVEEDALYEEPPDDSAIYEEPPAQVGFLMKTELFGSICLTPRRLR